MNWMKLRPVHAEDDGLVSVRNIYITALFHLVLEGICKSCHKVVRIGIPFEELSKDAASLTPVSNVITIADVAYLHNTFHVGMPPELPRLRGGSTS